MMILNTVEARRHTRTHSMKLSAYMYACSLLLSRSPLKKKKEVTEEEEIEEVNKK